VTPGEIFGITAGMYSIERRLTAENFNRLSRVHERYRQTDGRTTAISEREREFAFANDFTYSQNSFHAVDFGSAHRERLQIREQIEIGHNPSCVLDPIRSPG